ncbi:MAG: hypothetical protein M3081_18455 [Gemmatimonadota bacterium]|nr:hypothetical protein [Gemmatimonadota bacterium]
MGHRVGVSTTGDTTPMHRDIRAALRLVMRRAPGARAVLGAAPLERMGGGEERPTLVDAKCVEGTRVRAHVVPGDPHSDFAAFLDGTQHSEHVEQIGRAPIVWGKIAAGIRVRADRKLRSWHDPIVETRAYVPKAYLAPEILASLIAELGEDAVRDTSAPDSDGVIPAAHPVLLLERAKYAVSNDRDRAERALAERWCAEEQRPLFIDGGIGGSDIVAKAACAIGVIKSHRTLYVDGDAIDIVFALKKGERTSVISVASRKRPPLHSWYLRLRDPAGHDPLWGVVRVEVAKSAKVTGRADEVSRWVLTETAPNAMPDARWDKMSYGIRNAEEFLRAL